MENPQDWYSRLMAHGPLWLMFGAWVYLCVTYLPRLIEAHLLLLRTVRESTARLTAAYERLAGQKFDNTGDP